MKQKYDMLNVKDVVSISSSPLNLSYKLFTGNHVPDIVLYNFSEFGIVDWLTCVNLPEVPPMLGYARWHVINELMQLSRTLQELILTSTTWKSKVNDLIKLMNPKVFETFTYQIGG